MTRPPRRARRAGAHLLVLGVLLGPAGASAAYAQSFTPCDLTNANREFPHIPICAFSGAYRDSSIVRPDRCIGSFTGPMEDSVEARPRTVTVRFLRDRHAEARPNFGGYRIYRVINTPDSTGMVLIRRFSRQSGDERMWNFSVVDPATLDFFCRNRQGQRQMVNDSIVTFIDPDSVGNYIKVCKVRKPPNDPHGECQSPGDSVLVLDPPPGPHDGFRTWYAVTYEARNQSADGNYADLFVPDPANCAYNAVSVLVGNGNGTFGTNADLAAGSAPISVAIGDLNGDGKPDLATADQGSATVSVLLGNGNGSFGSKASFAAGNTPKSVAIGDLNGDGRPDLATANYYSNSVSVLLGSGNGSFGPSSDAGTGLGPTSVAIGDLDGDGKPDVAAANASSNTVSVLLGNGDGSFEAKTDYATGFGPVSVAIGDLNGDAKPDLATANVDSNTVSVLLGNGDGSFGATTDYATGGAPSSVAIGDLNGDAKPDLAVADFGTDTVSVLLGNGDGSFGAKTDYATGNGPASVAIGDLNGDGKRDLATANVNSNTVSVLLGNGDGSFGARTDYGTGKGPSSVAIGDLNGDGRLDLAVASYASCSNLNHKLLNLAGPVEPTGGPTSTLERVVVVPNPYRAHSPWEASGTSELHFINLPTRSLIRIYTVAGDLVTVLQHQDPIRDFERWNLKNSNGQDVASGIYMYRVEAESFSFQDRFIVIR